MQERFGLTINRNDLRKIKWMIQDNQTRIVEKQSNRATRHELEWEGHLIHVIYDKQRGELVTALLPEWSDVGSNRIQTDQEVPQEP